MNNRWIDVLKRNDFKLSVSIDGQFDLHFEGRGTVLSKYNKILENIDLMSEKGIVINALCVVRNESLGHENKINNYNKNTDKYFLQSTNPHAAKDLNKPREMWFLIEDKTPIGIDVPKELFYCLADLLEDNINVDGVFYVRNGNPNDIVRDYRYCLLIHNDCKSIDGLRNGLVGV